MTRVADGLLLRVRAAPGAPKTRVIGRLGDAMKVSVQAPPERGKANEELVRFLSKALGLDRASVRLKTGDTSRDKTFHLISRDPAAIEAAITELIGDDA